uniref:IPPc domain-containing protein n=1 Tax=Steinernema glaseri TaxID=37863 RepID=A0A1I7Z7V9_9BILA
MSLRGSQLEDPLKLADAVFWFGDLNFRLNYAEPVQDPLPFDTSQIHTSIFHKLQHDELYLESTKGTVYTLKQ